MRNVLATVSDEDFVDDYEQLMRLFENERQNFFSGIQENCIRLVQEARIPYLKDTMIAPVEDETKEDAAEKFIVKKKFVEAVEMMQGERKVLRRRGNLPKESTQVLKAWVDRNYDKPCKFLMTRCVGRVSCDTIVSRKFWIFYVMNGND